MTKNRSSKYIDILNNIYSKKYFLNRCAGYAAFNTRDGLDVRLKTALLNMNISKTSVLLDVAFGRGELLIYSILSGAKKIYGIDLSKSAIDIARMNIGRLPKKLQKRIHISKGIVQQLPYRTGMFTGIFYLDIIEHLNTADAKKSLHEVYRVLKKNGKIIIHTDNKFYIHGSRYIYYYLNTLWNRKSILDNQDFESTGHITFYSRVELRNLLEEIGFSRIQVNLAPLRSLNQIKPYFNIKNIYILNIIYFVSTIIQRTFIYNYLSPTVWAIAYK
jgi:ubiquinone/menaquinone biosynthesis C-methylase UbiE